MFSSPENPLGTYKTPDQISPPLPFDSIILVFLFIFPLYFMSQFYMMSIMNERVGRRGELLLSTPARPSAIILGKALPYFIGMVGISALLTLWIKASPLIVLPLIPVILFFLAVALLIGMISRSFKELSFISIFFSTIATSYLFFPSIFANIHVVSLISPAYPDRPHPAGNCHYGDGLPLFNLPVLAFRSGALLCRGGKFQGGTALFTVRPVREDQRFYCVHPLPETAISSPCSCLTPS